MRGNAVTEHAAQVIKQFALACSGDPTATDELWAVDVAIVSNVAPADNSLPLSRVRAAPGRMSAEKPSKSAGTRDGTHGEHDAALRQSVAVSDAMELAASL